MMPSAYSGNFLSNMQPATSQAHDTFPHNIAMTEAFSPLRLPYFSIFN